MKDIGQRIRDLRKEQGLTQEQLALALGYSDRSTIAKIETGKTDITQTQIAKISKRLGVSPLVLLGYEEEPASRTVKLMRKDVLNKEGQKRLEEFYDFLLQNYGKDEDNGEVQQIHNTRVFPRRQTVAKVVPRGYKSRTGRKNQKIQKRSRPRPESV